MPYSGNPVANPADDVRLRIGDTDAVNPRFTDGEIEFVLSEAGGDPLTAAVLAVEFMLAKMAPLFDESVGSVSREVTGQRDGYQALLDNLRRRLACHASPYAGGISRSDKLDQAVDRDRVPPQFTERMFAARGTTQVSSVSERTYTETVAGILPEP